MGDEERSEQACPVCGEHELALDQPPRIDVMGVQAYSDMLGMGDLRTEGTLGIVCLACGTHWRDKAAFDRNEPEPEMDEPEGAADEPAEEDFELGEEGDEDDSGDGE